MTRLLGHMRKIPAQLANDHSPWPLLPYGRVVRLLLWLALALLPLILLAVFFLSGPPSDIRMIERFERNLWALQDPGSNRFASREAAREWQRALRIKGCCSPGPDQRIDRWVVFSARSWSLLGGGRYEKGYAYVPDGVPLDGRVRSDLGRFRGLGHAYRHVTGSWYLYVFNED